MPTAPQSKRSAHTQLAQRITLHTHWQHSKTQGEAATGAEDTTKLPRPRPRCVART